MLPSSAKAVQIVRTIRSGATDFQRLETFLGYLWWRNAARTYASSKHEEEEKNVHRVGDFRKEHQGFGFIKVDGAIAVLPTPTFQLATSGQLVR